MLTEAQVQAFERDGCLSPVRAMSTKRARHYCERVEAREARVPDIKKMEVAPALSVGARDRRGPRILDIFEDLTWPRQSRAMKMLARDRL